MSGPPRPDPNAVVINDSTGPVPRLDPAPVARLEPPSGPQRAAVRPARVRVGAAWPAWGPDIRSGELDAGGGLSRAVLVRVRELSPTSASGRAWLVRLRDTRAALGAVPPAGVLHLLHSSPAGPRVVEVYEGFRGASLEVLVSAMRGANAGLAVRLAVQITAKVAAVAAGVDRHGGLVHPGITPASVLIDTRGELRVAGFLARPAALPPLASDDPLLPCWTGVPGYSPVAGPGAPGAGPLSVGALLLELLSGERPPPLSSDPSRLRRLMVQAFARPNELIPDDVIALVHECFTGTSLISLGAVAARLEAVERTIEGPDYADWVQDVVGPVLTGRPLAGGASPEVPSPMDGRFFTLHTNPGLAPRRPPPNLREAHDPEQEAATTIDGSGAARAQAIAPPPSAPAPAAPERAPAPTAPRAPPPHVGALGPVGGPAGGPAVPIEGPSGALERSPLSAAMIDGGRTMLQPSPAPAVNTTALTWLATSLALLVTAIIVYLIVDRLAAPVAGPERAPAAAPITAAPAEARPDPAPAAPPVEAAPEAAGAEAAAPGSAPEAPAADPGGGAAVAGVAPSTPPVPESSAPAATVGEAGDGGASPAAPVQPPRMRPAGGKARVRFVAGDPRVERMLVVCGGVRAEGEREVELDAPLGACEVTVRRGPQSTATRVQVTEARRFDCFVGGGRDCR